MKTKNLIFIAIVIGSIPMTYALSFWLAFDSQISNDPAEWGSLGDYFGGLANPFLSFISVLLIVKSIRLQQDSNVSIRNEINITEKRESTRAFEEKFFRLIDSLRTHFNEMEISFTDSDSNKETLKSTQAANRVVSTISQFETRGNVVSARIFVNQCDIDHQIHGCIRRFYVAVNLVSTEISDENGHSRTERGRYIETLINFTDISMIALIFKCVNHTEYAVSKKLLENQELIYIYQSLWVHPENVQKNDSERSPAS